MPVACWLTSSVQQSFTRVGKQKGASPEMCPHHAQLQHSLLPGVLALLGHTGQCDDGINQQAEPTSQPAAS